MPHQSKWPALQGGRACRQGVVPDQDSALDSLVAARHAVLADLAADRAELAAAEAAPQPPPPPLARDPAKDDSAKWDEGVPSSSASAAAACSPPGGGRSQNRPASAASLFGQLGGSPPRLDPLLQARALVTYCTLKAFS